MRNLSAALLLLLSSGCTHAGAYLIEPAPLWVPTAAVAPLPTPTVALAMSPTAVVTVMPVKRRKGQATDTPTATMTETPTATVTPTQAAGLFLMPFQDKRREKAVWKGRSIYENVVMEPVGATLQAKAWRVKPYSDMSFLWHRQFAYSLGQSGYSVLPAELPMSEVEGLALAKNSGAKLLLNGTILQLAIAKRGADDFLGTNFTGTNYFMDVELKLRLIEVGSGRVIQDRTVKARRTFFDPTRLGSNDRDTFPRYFGTGLPDLAMNIAGDVDLRNSLGLPTFTPTATPTQTPEAVKQAEGSAPTPLPTATPDQGPYWYNPKTGERVDSNWNFDPKDGTPRDKFVLRQATAVPTPSRATERK